MILTMFGWFRALRFYIYLKIMSMSLAPPNYIEWSTYFLHLYDLYCGQLLRYYVLGKHDLPETSLTQWLQNLVLSKIRLVIKLLTSAHIDTLFVFYKCQVLILELHSIDGEESDRLVLRLPVSLAYPGHLLLIQGSLEFILKQSIRWAILNQVYLHLLRCRRLPSTLFL